MLWGGLAAIAVLVFVYLQRREPIEVGHSLSSSGVGEEEGLCSRSGQLSDNPVSNCWVGLYGTPTVGGALVSGGMVYVGKHLPSIANTRRPDPALINADLPVDLKEVDHFGLGMSYWPSYSEVSSQARGAYLKWLEDGRRTPGTYIGYVFLFFYGLERRVLLDATHDQAAESELPQIAAEIEQLLAIYGDNRSFRGYATGLLDVISLRAGNETVGASTVHTARSSPPLALRRTLGNNALRGTPLDAQTAFAWVRSDSEIRLRTPATRCADEFEALFILRYAEEHGEGLVIKPCKRTLRVDYSPASASFSGETFSVTTDIPDVTSLVGPRRVLQNIALECDEALGSFSRWIGKNPEGRGTLQASAHLPAALVAHDPPEALETLRGNLETALGDSRRQALPVDGFVAPWLTEEGRQRKKQAVEMVSLLEQAGFGMEPDVRFGGKPLTRGDTAVFFRLEDESPSAPTPGYSAAALYLHLAAMVTTADDEIDDTEKRVLQEHLARGLLLSRAEHERLEAHLEWLLTSPPSIAGVKKRVEALTLSQRRDAARFLIEVALADGKVDPSEIKVLAKIYRALELDPGTVHDDLHQATAGGRSAVDAGPVVVRRSDGEPRTYAIPAPPAPDEDVTPCPSSFKDEPAIVEVLASPSHALDFAAIQAKVAETRAVSSLLATVFDDGERLEPQEHSSPATMVASADDDMVQGLDGPHTELLRALAHRPAWARDEYDALAEQLHLLPDGALDTLNDAAFDLCDDPLADGDDPIEIDQTVIQEMLA